MTRIEAPQRAADLERFWAKVLPGPGCWHWIGARDGRAQWQYGRFGLNGEAMTAHRASWLLNCGSIPDGFYVCHSCDNPPCVRPSHLFVGTPQENWDDCVAKGRARSAPSGRAVRWGEIDVRLDAPLEVVLRDCLGKYGAITALARELGVSVQVLYQRGAALGVSFDATRAARARANVRRRWAREAVAS